MKDEKSLLPELGNEMKRRTPDTRHPAPGTSSCTADFEQALWAQGYRRIAGVDEVGRGAWAGPVVTAAVIFAPGCFPPGLDDSKKLSPSERERLAVSISSQALAVAYGEQDAPTIDRINILAATRRAMSAAVTALSERPDYLLIDALRLPDLNLPQEGILHGDALVVSIAAASIVAKVYRDQLMTELDAVYPGYGFARHKGYGTKHHQQALADLGPCPIHRRSYRGVLPPNRLF